MQVRRLSPEEHILTRALYEEAFSEDSQEFVDYYYTEKTADNQIYVLEEDGGDRLYGTSESLYAGSERK